MSKHTGVTVQCHVCGANKEIDPKIVRAVNCHDELLEACRVAHNLVCRTDKSQEALDQVMDALVSAIARATGGGEELSEREHAQAYDEAMGVPWGDNE